MEKSGSESTQEFFNLWLNIYEDTFGKLVAMPTLGPTREKSEKMMKGFSTFVNLYTTWMKSNINSQSVFMEAMHNMSEKTTTEMDGENSPEKYRDFYRIWIETYSETFKEFLKSDNYASDNGKLMSYFMDFQQYTKYILEENYLKPMNLPTRTEIDEINKELYSLKKIVKELTKQIKEASGKTNTSVEKPHEST